jgi:predicted helicase
MASDQLIDFCLLKQGNGGTQGLPLYTYNAKQERLDNITDWGLEQFRKQYTDQTDHKRGHFLLYLRGTALSLPTGKNTNQT